MDMTGRSKKGQIHIFVEEREAALLKAEAALRGISITDLARPALMREVRASLTQEMPGEPR
jgi:hypothetical protein